MTQIDFEIPPGIPGPKSLEQKLAEREADRQYAYGPRTTSTHVPERAGPDKVLRDQLALAQARLAEAASTIAERDALIKELTAKLTQAERDIELLVLGFENAGSSVPP